MLIVGCSVCRSREATSRSPLLCLSDADTVGAPCRRGPVPGPIGNVARRGRSASAMADHSLERGDQITASARPKANCRRVRRQCCALCHWRQNATLTFRPGMLSGRSPAAASNARSRTSSRSASARSARNVGCEPEIEQPCPKANATSVRAMKQRYSRRASATVMGRYTRRRDRRGQAGLVARLLLVRSSDGPVRPRLRRRGDSGSRKRLAFEQGRARPQAGTRHVGADRAVAMVLGVSIALLGTRGARPDTRREQIPDGEEIPLAGSRKNPRRGVADVGAG